MKKINKMTPAELAQHIMGRTMFLTGDCDSPSGSCHGRIGDDDLGIKITIGRTYSTKLMGITMKRYTMTKPENMFHTFMHEVGHALDHKFESRSYESETFADYVAGEITGVERVTPFSKMDDRWGKNYFKGNKRYTRHQIKTAAKECVEQYMEMFLALVELYEETSARMIMLTEMRAGITAR